ncbi:amino acid adenylation domain-containing protein [Chloroflexi bacterium TSY]|nr:amino acid adenylation domain-containing protein [Chloroflexi bacterium TSY]
MRQILLQDWVTQRAEKRPDETALVMDHEMMSYGQLEMMSNQLARLLKSLGCQRGERVCFAVPKSPMSIVCLLGILKADCVYVPIDTASPASRARKIIEACENRLLLTTEPAASLVDELMGDAEMRQTMNVGWLSEDDCLGENFTPVFTRDDLEEHATTLLDYKNNADDLAYILFTSGSTGTPKGVPITHENVRHFVDWGNRYFGTGPDDQVSGHSPLHFDLSVFDIFGAFAAGAQLHLVSPKLNLLPHKLAEFIRESELTQWFSVPSLLNYMAKFDVVQQDDFPTLKRLLWCGEVFPTPGLIYWMQRLPHVTFTNLYGPTEATIASSYYTVPRCPEDETKSVPIGVACAGEQLLVLDEARQPIPAGEVGDLYISGVGLSPGYWKDSEKTKAAFSSVNGHGPEQRVYKTGDLARIGEEGLVYFHGRADSQIKSRGYRIELGEIESALSAIDYVDECAVVAVDESGFGGAIICCAYVPTLGIEVTPVLLRKQLSEHLPNYMLPARWMAFEEFPKNVNGKIDRQRLKEQFQKEA